MFVVRETFTAKPGKASQLAQLFKQVMSEMPRMKPRVSTDFIGQFNTVVLETEARISTSSRRRCRNTCRGRTCATR